MAAAALKGSSRDLLARSMPCDLLPALHAWVRDALEETERAVDKDLKECVSSLLGVFLLVPPHINRISSSQLGKLITALRDPKKSKSLLNRDAGLVKAASEVREEWSKAQEAQKSTGRLPGDLTPAQLAAAAAAAAPAAAAAAQPAPAAAASGKASSAAAAAAAPAPALGSGMDTESEAGSVGSSKSSGSKRRAEEDEDRQKPSKRDKKDGSERSSRGDKKDKRRSDKSGALRVCVCVARSV
jgi:hypothetical protein